MFTCRVTPKIPQSLTTASSKPTTLTSEMSYRLLSNWIINTVDRQVQEHEVFCVNNTKPDAIRLQAHLNRHHRRVGHKWEVKLVIDVK